MKINDCFLLQCGKDSFLMNDIHPIVSSYSNLKIFNAYRLYLNVLLLFDIKAIKGISGVLLDDKIPLPIDNFHWPLQLSHNKKSWKTWYRTITYLCCIKTKSLTLWNEKRLGFWKVTHFQYTQHLSFLYSSSMQEIYHRKKTPFINSYLPPSFHKQSLLFLILIQSTHIFQNVLFQYKRWQKPVLPSSH